MTLSPWIIYLWGIVDNIHDVATAIAIICGVLCLFGVIMSLALHDEIPESLLPIVKKSLSRGGVVFITSLILALLVPSSKTIAVMVIAPALVNSQPVQKDLPELYQIAIQALKDSFKEKSK